MEVSIEVKSRLAQKARISFLHETGKYSSVFNFDVLYLSVRTNTNLSVCLKKLCSKRMLCQQLTMMVQLMRIQGLAR